MKTSSSDKGDAQVDLVYQLFVTAFRNGLVTEAIETNVHGLPRQSRDSNAKMA